MSHNLNTEAGSDFRQDGLVLEGVQCKTALLERLNSFGNAKRTLPVQHTCAHACIAAR